MKLKYVAFCGLGVFLACSSPTTSTPATDAGNGTDTGNGDGGAGNPTQSGRIVDYVTMTPVKIATVTPSTGAGMMVDMTGKYSFSVPKGMAYTWSVTGMGYLKLIEQESMLMGDVARGDTSFVDTSTQALLQSSLAGYDSSLGVLSFGIQKKASCASFTGATVKIMPSGMEKTVYFKGGFPSAVDMSATDDMHTVAAVVYNIPAGTLTFAVTHPTCKQTAFPVPDTSLPNLVYTGKAVVEAGMSASFARVVLE